MKILLFTAFFMPGFKGGGPIKTTANLIRETKSSVSYSVVTKDRDLGDLGPYKCVNAGKWNQFFGCNVFYTKPGSKGLRDIFNSMRKESYDLVYLNSFFAPNFSFFPLLLAKIFRKPVMLAPRGEFSVGALGLKSLKKKVYIFFYLLFRLQKDVLFQASTESEKNDIKRVLGDNVQVFVAENIGSKDFAGSLAEKNGRELRVVFVSRISPMKNLAYALDVLKFIQKPISYHIYGPIEDVEYWSECLRRIEKLPSHISVIHKGSIAPKDVIATLSKYDLFFLPSKGENYGHVIVEALCAGLPVLIADTTPWRGLQEKGVGWDLPLGNPQAFVEVLEETFMMSSSEHTKFRQRVLVWAKERLSQRDAVEANLAMFRYALEKK